MFFPQKEMVIVCSDGGASELYDGNPIIIHKCLKSTLVYFNLYNIHVNYISTELQINK